MCTYLSFFTSNHIWLEFQNFSTLGLKYVHFTCSTRILMPFKFTFLYSNYLSNGFSILSSTSTCSSYEYSTKMAPDWFDIDQGDWHKTWYSYLWLRFALGVCASAKPIFSFLQANAINCRIMYLLFSWLHNRKLSFLKCIFGGRGLFFVEICILGKLQTSNLAPKSWKYWQLTLHKKIA